MYDDAVRMTTQYVSLVSTAQQSAKLFFKKNGKMNLKRQSEVDGILKKNRTVFTYILEFWYQILAQYVVFNTNRYDRCRAINSQVGMGNLHFDLD